MELTNARPIGMSLSDPDGADGFVQSIARGIAVIRAFGPGRERLTMAQVAVAADLTRAGARRILHTLNSLGYVGVDGRFFYLTSQVIDLGRGYLAQSLWELARPELQKVADEIGETVSAGVLDGFDVVYTVRLRSPQIIQLELAPGAHLPAHGSSMGQVLLAALPPVGLASYLRQAKLERYTPNTLVDREALTERLRQVRERGWCVARGEIDEGTTGIAVPLVDTEDRTLAAISVALNTERATDELVDGLIVPRLLQAAQAITASL